MTLPPGSRLGSYAIVSSLGAGGMGEVYRARDSRLDREVAVKVLPIEMAADPDRLRRFQREARAVAALNHPHIVTIHSVEEVDGIHFLTMELIEGQTLAELMSAGLLPIEWIVSAATALADALTAAHEKGIVHRDLKPGNIMMTSDGRLKVLDFGLAKETNAKGAEATTENAIASTESGAVMGTPAYMSPEQLTAAPLDHRTDLFSLGIVLYEAVAGRRPFAGATSIELASAILRDSPLPLGQLRSDVPADLARLIERCLAKEPQRRVQTARDVGNALREINQAVRPGAADSDDGFWIAVLPFKFTGTSADLAALADGFSEELITGLSRFSYLRVLARGSAKAAAARYVIEGSLRQAGTTVRVAAQLIDRSSGVNLWAETYDRAFRAEEIFALQDDLVPRIVSTVADLNGVLCRSMSTVMRGRDQDRLTPYQALVRGFGFNDRVTPAEHVIVRDVLERAVRQAPASADCWALLSMIYSAEYANSFNPRPDPLGRALEAAKRAIDAAPTGQLAHYALAMALFFAKEREQFRHEAGRVVELNPMNGAIMANLGMLVAYSGDWQRGCALIERAARVNPQHPGWYLFALVYDAYRKGEYRTALEVIGRINMPDFFSTLRALAIVHAQLGDRDQAQKAIGRVLAIRPDYATTAREDLNRWYEPALVENIVDGLRKAGLQIE